MGLASLWLPEALHSTSGTWMLSPANPSSAFPWPSWRCFIDVSFDNSHKSRQTVCLGHLLLLPSDLSLSAQALVLHHTTRGNAIITQKDPACHYLLHLYRLLQTARPRSDGMK